MDQEIIKTDIRLIKLKDYVSRHPGKPIGYYCLARMYTESGSYGVAEELLNKVITKDNLFGPALVAMIDLYIKQGRLLKATFFYNKNKDFLESRRIYKTQTARAVTSIFCTKKASFRRNIIHLQLLNPVSGFFDEKDGNLVARLLLGMYKLANNACNEKALSLYGSIMNISGISDSFRWQLLKTLAKHSPGLYKERNIACLFDGIPEGCSPSYANAIFASSLENRDDTRITRIYNDLDKQSRLVSSSNLWKYIAWKKSISKLDHTVLECCRRLIKAGWMDRVLATTMTELHSQEGFSLSTDEKNILELFGY